MTVNINYTVIMGSYRNEIQNWMDNLLVNF